MNNLYNQTDVWAMLARVEKLQSTDERHWGKMNVEQMLSHVNAALETATGQNFPERTFMGKIIGRFFRHKVLNDKPLDKNTPTDKNYLFTGSREFETEKAKTISLINTFHINGPSKCTTHPHSFFGKFTPEEWAISQWKHLDHHLRQFGG
jgi:hypothetical protein